ncbi:MULTISPECIES: anti-repressor SinI family protein [Metabacillus]|uniref:DNA-binding anti-repressor SinI n=1 Tax=Metabacillus elymi TaxID=2745198 RepID=A0ABX6S1Q2_9BACI|nr:MULTISPECIES: anti-repressor SinI family protein [Metabacillus]QNF27396.1 DNA-binding anti-repressor SinI [Metabacillus sp. KUDC1714]
MLSSLIIEKGLDKEWVELILSALEIGISVEEIKAFINQSPRPE